jgi:Ulp1 family protease
VEHEASNIEITREKMQCLKFGAWLNDEVSFSPFMLEQVFQIILSMMLVHLSNSLFF